MRSLAQKQRIVFTTWGSFGDLHPHMALALELQERGYQSVIATSLLYREKVEAAGIHFHPVRPDIPPLDAESSAEIIRRASHARNGPSYLFATPFRIYAEPTLITSCRDRGRRGDLLSRTSTITASLERKRRQVASHRPFPNCVYFGVRSATLHSAALRSRSRTSYDSTSSL